MSVLRGEGRYVILYGTVDVPSGSRTMPAYLARPDLGGEWPTVVVIPPAWGVTSAVKDLCRRLARQGVAAIAPDPYLGYAPPQGLDREEARRYLAKIPDELLHEDLAIVVEFITNPAGHWSNAEDGFAVLGVGDGGGVALDAATSHDPVRALALLAAPLRPPEEIPGVAPADRLEETTCPVLLLVAGDDPESTPDAVTEVRRTAPWIEVARYEGVGPGFWDDFREDYDGAAAGDAFGRLAGFLARSLPEHR